MASFWPTFLIFFIVAFGASLGFPVLISWLIFISHKIKFYVTDATLTQFNLTNNTQLHYNLGLYFTITNPHQKIGIYYDAIEATTIYKDQSFDTKWLVPFYQVPMATSLLKARFNGLHQLVPIANGKVVNSEFDSEKLAGVFAIDVKLRLSVRLKIGFFKIVRARPKVGCGFKAQLSFNESSIPSFGITGCRVAY